MNTKHHYYLSAAVGLILGVSTTLTGLSGNTAEIPSKPIAIVNNYAFFIEDIADDDEVIIAQYEAAMDVYEKQREVLKNRIGNYLLQEAANRENMTVEMYLKKYAMPPQSIDLPKNLPELHRLITDADMTEEEIMFIWNKLDDEEKREFRELVNNFLTSEEAIKIYQQVLIDRLIENSNTTINLLPPKVPNALRISVKTQHHFERGDAKAPITIHEFSDYTCHSCQTTQQTLQQLHQLYPDKIRWVYHPVLIDNELDSISFQLIEASYCANDQQKFWDFHDIVYQQENLNLLDLQQIAKQINLEEKSFMECIHQHKYYERVLATIKETENLDFIGVPYFVLNGIEIEGSPSLELMKKLIEVELL